MILTSTGDQMNHVRLTRAASVFVWVASADLVSAQTDMKGHWTGSIDTSAGSLIMEIDLDQAASGRIGSISIPAQNASGMPLDAISFSGGKGTFRIKGAPADPTFSGMLSADGKTLDGQFSQGLMNMPLKLNRTGGAKVEVPKASPPVARPNSLGVGRALLIWVRRCVLS